MEIKNYSDVIEHFRKKNRQHHLLIGNGFSIAYDPGIFSYNALSDFLMHSDEKELKEVFTVFNTQNFELVMEQLDNFITIAKILTFPDKCEEKIKTISKELKDSLITAVSQMHPEQVFSIPEENSEACAKFLREYLDNNGSVFSTNYDLLLYWVMMRNDINSIDGFGRDPENLDTGEYIPEEEIEWSELRWGKHKGKQNVHYLHGSLPLFDTGTDIIKEEYTGECILERIKERMKNGHFPVFVTAGDAKQKMRHISHNKYLTYCYDSLCNIHGSLVTIGFSFGENDHHIIEAINKAAKHGQKMREKLHSVYIGVYSEEDLHHMQSIEDKFECKVNYFDVKTANIWH